VEVDVRDVVVARAVAVANVVVVVPASHVVAGVGDALELPLADVLVPVDVLFDQSSAGKEVKKFWRCDISST
jgi:hypothetical protein